MKQKDLLAKLQELEKQETIRKINKKFENQENKMYASIAKKSLSEMNPKEYKSFHSQLDMKTNEVLNQLNSLDASLSQIDLGVEHLNEMHDQMEIKIKEHQEDFERNQKELQKIKEKNPVKSERRIRKIMESRKPFPVKEMTITLIEKKKFLAIASKERTFKEQLLKEKENLKSLEESKINSYHNQFEEYKRILKKEQDSTFQLEGEVTNLQKKLSDQESIKKDVEFELYHSKDFQILNKLKCKYTEIFSLLFEKEKFIKKNYEPFFGYLPIKIYWGLLKKKKLIYANDYLNSEFERREKEIGEQENEGKIFNQENAENYTQKIKGLNEFWAKIA